MEEDLREVKFLLEYISSVLEKLALCDALENEDSATRLKCRKYEEEKREETK